MLNFFIKKLTKYKEKQQQINDELKNIQLTSNLVYSNLLILSSEELKALFEHNLDKFIVIKSNISFENDKLSKELNYFFNKYEHIEYSSYIFSQKLIKEFEYNEGFMVIGKYQMIDLVVRYNKNSVGFSDVPDTFTETSQDETSENIYFLLLNRMMVDLFLKLKDPVEKETEIKDFIKMINLGFLIS